MKKYILSSALISIALLFYIQINAPVSGKTLSNPVPAPTFTHPDKEEWLNSPPLSWNDLHGKVVLIDFWAFECWNCYRSFPWLTAMEARLPKEHFQIIGVHSPEFDREKIKANVIKKAAEFNLHHPIMIDNDFSYWKALNNRYWPAYYIVDKENNIRAVFYGETHEGNKQAKAIERIIKELIAE